MALNNQELYCNRPALDDKAKSIMKSPKIFNKVIAVTNLIGVKFFLLLVVLLLLSFGIVIYVNIYFLTSFSREDVV
ncbi:MAG: hypothetical protein KJ800_01805, partial [Proteobacteria bacterium]|nr:hypothetical protein [Pseudomonadota bacterium]